jgi:putative ABC transport system permease protein
LEVAIYRRWIGYRAIIGGFRMIKELLTRLRFILSPRPSDESDKEQFHVEQSTQANVAAGMTLQEARRQALISLREVERTREEAHEPRPGWLMGTVAQDIRYALRGFRRNPIFTITVIGTLGLGIGTTTSVFSVVDRILFRSLPFDHPDRLVSLGIRQSLEPQEFTLGAFYYLWRDNQKPFVALTSENAVSHECDLTDSKSAQLNCMRAQANFLPTLGILPVLGRNFLPEEDRPNGSNVALISYGLWLNHYARDPGILNKLIEIDGNRVRVIGVLPKEFEMPDLQPADVVFPLAVDETTQHSENQGLGTPMRTFARLKDGVTIEQARASLQPLFPYAQKLIPPDSRKDFHLEVRSLRDRQMQGARLIAWVLFGAVLVMLLIAWANIASLLIARGVTRGRELAVRSALGASRGRLIRQALTEALLFSIAGATAGCLLAEILLRIFVSIAPAGVPFLGQAHLDLRLILFTIVLSFLCGAMFGLIPALHAPRLTALTVRSTQTAAYSLLRRSLVVGQIAASMVLLAGGMLLLHSFWNLQNQRLGIRIENTITASISLGQRRYAKPEPRLAFFQQLLRQLQFGPGVISLAVSNSLPPSGGQHSFYSSLVVSGRPPLPARTGGMITSRLISPAYFRALDIPILEGQSFTEEEQNSNDHVLVLSQQLATRLFPGKKTIGEHLQLDSGEPNSPWYTVIGIAANVKNNGLTGEEEPEFYNLRHNRAEDWASNFDRKAVLIVKTSLPSESLSRWIRSQIESLDPTVLLSVETLRQRVGQMADQPRFEAVLVGFFAVTGLLLSMIGLYGVIVFIANQRTQEIGIRMALGASRFDILYLVSREGVRLIALGGVIGLGLGLGFSRLFKSLLFGIGPYDPMTFIGVALLLVLVALAATLIPARVAMSVEPVAALHYE